MQLSSKHSLGWRRAHLNNKLAASTNLGESFLTFMQFTLVFVGRHFLMPLMPIGTKIKHQHALHKTLLQTCMETLFAMRRTAFNNRHSSQQLQKWTRLDVGSKQEKRCQKNWATDGCLKRSLSSATLLCRGGQPKCRRSMACAQMHNQTTIAKPNALLCTKLSGWPSKTNNCTCSTMQKIAICMSNNEANQQLRFVSKHDSIVGTNAVRLSCRFQPVRVTVCSLWCCLEAQKPKGNGKHQDLIIASSHAVEGMSAPNGRLADLHSGVFLVTSFHECFSAPICSCKDFSF